MRRPLATTAACLAALTAHADVNPTIGEPASPSGRYDQPQQGLQLGGSPSGVLVYCQEGASVCSDVSFDELTSFYVGIGGAPVEEAGALPQDLSPYRLILLAPLDLALAGDDVAALRSFVDGDDGSPGRLVVTSDNEENFPDAPAQQLLDDLGVDITFNERSEDRGCGSYASGLGADRLRRGIPDAARLEYGWTTTLTVGPEGKVIAQRESSPDVIMAVYPAEREVLGDVVVAGDINLFDDSCDVGVFNSVLWRNLVLY